MLQLEDREPWAFQWDGSIDVASLIFEWAAFYKPWLRTEVLATLNGPSILVFRGLRVHDFFASPFDWVVYIDGEINVYNPNEFESLLKHHPDLKDADMSKVYKGHPRTNYTY